MSYEMNSFMLAERKMKTRVERKERKNADDEFNHNTEL